MALADLALLRRVRQSQWGARVVGRPRLPPPVVSGSGGVVGPWREPSVKRADALAEARRRWGDGAWVRFKMAEPRIYQVGYTVVHFVGSRSERTMAAAASWKVAFEIADRSKARTGFTRIYLSPHSGKPERTGLIDGGNRQPTMTECFAVLDLARDHEVACVVWQWDSGQNPRNVVAIRRCACGEVAIRDEVCGLCRALAPLVVSQDPSSLEDLDTRYETADRFLDRIGAVVAELKRQAMTPT